MTREQRAVWELNHLYLLEDPASRLCYRRRTNPSRTVEPPLDGVENWLSKKNLDPEADRP